MACDLEQFDHFISRADIAENCNSDLMRLELWVKRLVILERFFQFHTILSVTALTYWATIRF